MAQSGIYWFNDGPDSFAQKLSTASKRVGPATYEITEELLFEAADRLTDIQLDSKQVDGKIVGGPARVSGDMLRAIDYNVSVGSRARVQGEYGFINGAPDHTVYKEQGTQTGMIPMMGLNKVNVWLEGAAEAEFERSFWKEVGLL